MFFRLPRRGERGEIGHRSAAHKKPTGFSIEPENLPDPIDRQALEFHRRWRRTPDGEIGVQGRSEQVGEPRNGSARRLDITKHARMRVLPAKWNDRVAKNFEQGIKIDSFDRKLRVEPLRISCEDV